MIQISIYGSEDFMVNFAFTVMHKIDVRTIFSFLKENG
jgi:hypothetical protein